MLSSKVGKEAYVQPIVESDSYHFEVRTGKPPESAKNGTKLARGANFRCLMSDTPIDQSHIRGEFIAKRAGERLMAIVAEGAHGRVYLAPTNEQEAMARSAQPDWKPEQMMEQRSSNLLSGRGYGFTQWHELFTPRQLVALTTFSDLVPEAIEKCRQDYLGARASRPRNTFHRTHLPHFEAGETAQHITFRLHDSLPIATLASWDNELRTIANDTERDRERRRRIEDALDQGLGACWLRRADIAEIVATALAHFDGTRYRLYAWVIMPNHVHVLIAPLFENSLSSIVHSWKSFTAKKINALLHRDGEFWQADYFDRFIRNAEQWEKTLYYIRNNPVKAGLCKTPEDWQWQYERDPPGSEGILPSVDSRAGRPRSQDDVPLDEGGTGATAYAQAVGVYLAIAVDKTTDYSSSLVAWSPTRSQAKTTFARQALPMVWDYAEINPMAGAAGDMAISLAGICRAFPSLGSIQHGFAKHADAQTQNISASKVISTDPPYYDNIGYADLSDFFYVWLRKSLKPIFPGLYATVAVPKAEELVATPYRHGGKTEAESFFLDGMTHAMHNLAQQAHPAFPVTIYYAFKQSDTQDDGDTHSTGWVTFLEAVLRAGFALTGTWPMRTERDARSIGIGTNALASSIVLVCRQRAADAPTISRREFIRELNAVLPDALLDMTRGGVNSPVAPVDLSQAIIGPGMAIFSQYSAVLEADGTSMSVRTALQLINRFFAEDDFDHDTQFCLAWFEQQGWATAKFGDAEVLARAKGTTPKALADAGVVESGGGSLRLLRWAELDKNWTPASDDQTPIWESLHQLIRALNQDGESAAGQLLARMPACAEQIRSLAYRLYTLCERKSWAEDARAYNELVTAWGAIESEAASAGVVRAQGSFDM